MASSGVGLAGQIMALLLLCCISSMCHGRSIDGLASATDSREDVMQGKLHSAPGWGLYVPLAVMLLLAGVGVLVAFPVVMVCIVRMLGFTADGIIMGSRAAWIMSLYAGRVTVGSICAICQSIGALGVASFSCLGPVIVVLAVLSLLTFGIVECVRMGFFHSLGAYISEMWNTIVGAGIWNTIHLHVSSFEAHISEIWDTIVGAGSWNTVHLHVSSFEAHISEIWDTISGYAAPATSM